MYGTASPYLNTTDILPETYFHISRNLFERKLPEREAIFHDFRSALLNPQGDLDWNVLGNLPKGMKPVIMVHSDGAHEMLGMQFTGGANTRQDDAFYFGFGGHHPETSSFEVYEALRKKWADDPEFGARFPGTVFAVFEGDAHQTQAFFDFVKTLPRDPQTGSATLSSVAHEPYRNSHVTTVTKEDGTQTQVGGVNPNRIDATRPYPRPTWEENDQYIRLVVEPAPSSHIIPGSEDWLAEKNACCQAMLDRSRQSVSFHQTSRAMDKPCAAIYSLRENQDKEELYRLLADMGTGYVMMPTPEPGRRYSPEREKGDTLSLVFEGGQNFDEVSDAKQIQGLRASLIHQFGQMADFHHDYPLEPAETITLCDDAFSVFSPSSPRWWSNGEYSATKDFTPKELPFDITVDGITLAKGTSFDTFTPENITYVINNEQGLPQAVKDILREHGMGLPKGELSNGAPLFDEDAKAGDKVAIAYTHFHFSDEEGKDHSFIFPHCVTYDGITNPLTFMAPQNTSVPHKDALVDFLTPYTITPTLPSPTLKQSRGQPALEQLQEIFYL